MNNCQSNWSLIWPYHLQFEDGGFFVAAATFSPKTPMMSPEMSMHKPPVPASKAASTFIWTWSARPPDTWRALLADSDAISSFRPETAFSKKAFGSEASQILQIATHGARFWVSPSFISEMNCLTLSLSLFRTVLDLAVLGCSSLVWFVLFLALSLSINSPSRPASVR